MASRRRPPRPNTMAMDQALPDLLSRLPAFLSTRSTTGRPDPSHLTRRRSFPACLAALSIRTTSPDSAAIVAKAAPVSATAQEVSSSPSLSSSGWAVDDLLQFSLRAPSTALMVYHKSIRDKKSEVQLKRINSRRMKK
ncbi:hypothetical protein VPH35_090328 [Triticum aestivum]|uniref:uncharacterized protein n=1 Tax=Triticum aestivum TaxID=4565 RepID=UPI001D02925C|nr:uncharacterized protein LOC123112061 [Triticum aestivum]